MTKVLEWLAGLAAAFAVWYAIQSGAVAADWARRNPVMAFWWPVVSVAVFGLYCVCAIAYRVLTFNDCEEAAKQLQEEINEAKCDLAKKGVET